MGPGSFGGGGGAGFGGAPFAGGGSWGGRAPTGDGGAPYMGGGPPFAGGNGGYPGGGPPGGFQIPSGASGAWPPTPTTGWSPNSGVPGPNPNDGSWSAPPANDGPTPYAGVPPNTPSAPAPNGPVPPAPNGPGAPAPGAGPTPNGPPAVSTTGWASDTDFQKSCLDAGNVFRQKFDAPPYVWNATLANVAQKATSSCAPKPADLLFNGKFAWCNASYASSLLSSWNGIGLNGAGLQGMGAFSGLPGYPSSGQGAWDLQTPQWTQIFGKTVSQVGCGRTQCDKGWVVVCKFSASGNGNGQANGAGKGTASGLQNTAPYADGPASAKSSDFKQGLVQANDGGNRLARFRVRSLLIGMAVVSAVVF
ncbi:hypothetical protein EJ06DRAFT_525964 [Trichodelitschia bisporula]|uniref:SCP domain-containing protein n=1 Tax=Trichodelitschia bisporula TaxID=703511 RepID=A0A6G1IBK5_9PEZI|nr:hypothetical protein EJ06DRAFT_525964 [Trichodelitschia bisporula]